MSTSKVSDHYTHGGLLAAITAGVAKLGKRSDTVTMDDLGPVDEFHIGGRGASEAFLGQLELSADHRVLDVGCGLGGPARFVADRYGARVTGIDLTPEYVETGTTLCGWLGLAERIELHEGSALSMPFPDATFDRGYMMHVGMNIADKTALYAEVSRVLRPGSLFGVYDVMRTADADLEFPVPWASTADTSAVASPQEYRTALAAAGFTVRAERDRRDFALEFFEQLRARAAGASGPPALGLHILMGETAPVKVQNMIKNISAGRIAPVEMVAVKSA